MEQKIDMTKIPQYAPTDAVAIRIYNYLSKVSEKVGAAVSSREELIEMGIKNGLNKNLVWEALKNLENVVDVAWFWDSNAKTVFYAVVPMSPEEKVAMIESAVWFEMLP